MTKTELTSFVKMVTAKTRPPPSQDHYLMSLLHNVPYDKEHTVNILLSARLQYPTDYNGYTTALKVGGLPIEYTRHGIRFFCVDEVTVKTLQQALQMINADMNLKTNYKEAKSFDFWDHKMGPRADTPVTVAHETAQCAGHRAVVAYARCYHSLAVLQMAEERMALQ